VATADDLIPASHPVEMRDGTTVPVGGHIHIWKVSYVNIPIEGLDLCEDIWGKDARVFKCVWYYSNVILSGLDVRDSRFRSILRHSNIQAQAQDFFVLCE
jgi:hypothetical protein